jgi:hypothetical protein
MFIYQYLQIENYIEISESIKYYLKNHTSVLTEKLLWKFLEVDPLLNAVPQLDKVFKKYDLEIVMAAVVYRQPHSQGGIHIDSSTFFRVLWPVMNCSGSKTKFFKYDSKKFIPRKGIDGDKNLSVIPGEKLDFLDEFELNKPVIFDPSIPHGVYCNPNFEEPRVSITFGFNVDPKHIMLNESNELFL